MNESRLSPCAVKTLNKVIFSGSLSVNSGRDSVFTALALYLSLCAGACPRCVTMLGFLCAFDRLFSGAVQETNLGRPLTFLVGGEFTWLVPLLAARDGANACPLQPLPRSCSLPGARAAVRGPQACIASPSQGYSSEPIVGCHRICKCSRGALNSALLLLLTAALTRVGRPRGKLISVPSGSAKHATRLATN